MEEYIFYTIIIIFILFLIYQWRITLNQKKQLENQLEQKVNELKEINDEKIKFETLVNENKDKSELIDNERNKVIENFKEYFNSSLINQFSDATEKSNKVILETAKNTFEAANKLSKEQLTGIVNPISAQTKEVKQSLTNIKTEYGKVTQYLDGVKDTMTYVGNSARDLNTALRGDNQAIGNWGQEALERIFVNNGLTKNVDFFPQQKQANGLVPDYILEIRDNEKMIFDSKVSIKKFLDATREKDPNVQKKLFKEHSGHIKDKVRELIKAKYPEHVPNSMDRVIMFVPNENALLKALEVDSGLFEYAFKNNVILMGTTNILLLLEQIHSFKKYSHSMESVKKILSGVDSVIKHLTNTHKYIETLGGSIATTTDNYNKLIGNVESSVIPSFKKLHKERHNKEYSGKIPNIKEGDVRKIDSNKLSETKKLIDTKRNEES